MSSLDIKKLFSQRILKDENDAKEVKDQRNGSHHTPLVPTATSIKENDVGITEYVSDLPGFVAVIKQRYSDFNVHEIDLDGNIVALDSYELPDETAVEIAPPACISAEILPDLDKVAAGDDDVQSVKIDVSDMSKEDRKTIHQFVKGKYGAAVISDTLIEGEKTVLNVRKCEKGEKDNRRPSHIPKFLHFSMFKSNMDTMDALNVLATKLRQKSRNFAICGTKDKRGNTTQRVSISQLYASQLNKLNKTLWRMSVGNFVYKDFALSLGALKGNNFQIALRGITVPDSEVELALEKIKEHGFINYFGLQRFGNCAEVPTHEVGLQLIKEAYSNAVDLILKPRSNIESPDLKQAREIWSRSRDAAQAFSALRSKDRTIEGKILYGLKTHGATAYSNALDLLPRNVRLLYLHAYQSFVWNKVVSLRVAKFGLEPLEGDLVFADESAVLDVAIESEEIAASEDVTDAETEKGLKGSPVKVLTASDVSSYTIFDIVLPLPGTTSSYPENEISEWYKDLLAKDGLTVDSFTSKARQYSLGGCYRHVIQKPKNLSWKIVRYSNADDDLIPSDIDILNKKTLPDHPDGSFKAAILSFDLRPSSYATMALREMLRADTSKCSQSQLNDSTVKRSSEEDMGGNAKKRKGDE